MTEYKDPEMAKADKILREVKAAGGWPWRLLQAKCRAEGYGTLKTIIEFGDPRTWPRPL